MPLRERHSSLEEPSCSRHPSRRIGGGGGGGVYLCARLLDIYIYCFWSGNENMESCVVVKVLKILTKKVLMMHLGR